jgi:2-oxoglutarate dehydrogenase E2 component (dihydrolipoamide succinyltransferase)
MATQVLMPRLGESVDEGTITRWLKTEGEPVRELEPLLEVNTDKVDTEIPSPAGGVLLKIIAPQGSLAQAGMVLAWIGQPGEALAGGAPAPAAPAPAPAVAPAPATALAPGRHPQLGFISPVVAKLASEHGLDLGRVTGTGAGGRITKKDVLTYLAAAPALPPPAAPTLPSAPVVSAPPAAAPALPPAPAPAPALPGELIPHTAMRRSIAEHMVHSKRTSPHVTTVMEADMSRVAAHREANKAAFSRDGVNLTFTAYLVAAAVAALRAFPLANSSWSDEGIRLHREINIGMAASLGGEGLIVPVIRNADSLSLLGLARAINDLAARARQRQLKPDEVRGGTFTLTNHGTSGSLFATPIINQPQCAILGAGVIQKRVVVIQDAIAIRPMVYLSLTFDHRILDGASGDAFLGKVVESLQNWS